MGFARKIWGKMGIDKVSLMPNGVFLVRFQSIEGRNKAIAAGPFIFDNKPVIVKNWAPNLDLRSECRSGLRCLGKI